MDLDVILATRNRSSLLREALASLLAAEVPAGLRVAITVVDNNSSDETAAVVREISSRSALPVRYMRETRTGKSYALNAGLASTSGELAGFIDDDEQIEASWYARIAEAFQDPSLDFIGGPYLARWAAPAPRWLPRQARGIIGCFAFAETPQPYGNSLPGAVLFGGNAAIRRSILNRAGPYRTDLIQHADQEMFERLLAGGARGMYLPQLAIYHWIPRERLQKRYFRTWMWKAGSAYARIHPNAGSLATIAGIPRYLFRKTAHSLVRWCWRLAASNCPDDPFEAELDLIYSLSLSLAHFRARRSNFGSARRSAEQTRNAKIV